MADDLLSRVQAADALRVIAEPEEPGWSVIRPNGQARGFAAQVASRVAKELGVKATFSPEQPDAALEGGWGDRADISFEHLAATDARASALVFSQPYAWEPIGFAAAASSGVNPDDLAGRWVCVEAGSIAEGWLQGSVALVDGAGGQANAPSVGQIVSAGSDEDCLAAVQGGSADAWATSAMTISSSVDDGAELSASSAPAGWAPIAAAVDPSVPGYESLLAAVDAAITTLRDDGTLAQLSERALGSDVSSPPAGTAEVGLTTEETNGG